jgi:hypothetical protein
MQNALPVKLPEGRFAEDSKRFRFLASDTHMQVARKGDDALSLVDAINRPRHV